MTWRLNFTAAQPGLKPAHRPDSSLPLPLRRGWTEKTVILFGTAILLATSGLAQTPPPYTVTVSLFNDARVPRSIVDSAEQTASRIYEQSGIELHWILCGRAQESVEEQRACGQTLFPEHLHVHIVNSDPHLKGSVFGISYFSADGIGSQADVFYSKIVGFQGVSCCGTRNSARTRYGPRARAPFARIELPLPDRPHGCELAHCGSHSHGAGRACFQRGAIAQDEGNALDFRDAKRPWPPCGFRHLAFLFGSCAVCAQ